MGVKIVAKQEIPGTNVYYVDADGNENFNPCDGRKCDYYESDGRRLASNDPLIKEALYDYQIEGFSGSMRNLGFLFEDMRKILSPEGDPSLQSDGATAIAAISPENEFALPLLNYVVDNDSGEFDQIVVDAARESIAEIDSKR